MEITQKKHWIREMFKDKAFFQTLMVVALPIVIQNLISSSLNMIDTLMIGKVGQAEIAAVGVANQLFMLIMLGLTGICAGSGIFISQYWGKGDTKNIKRIVGFSLMVGVVYAAIITAIVQVIPTPFISFFNKEPQILKLGVEYLKIVSISYIFTAITFAYSYALRSVGQTRIPMIVSGVAVLVNIIGNSIFIFGLGPAPVMGVAGAALATVLARIVESVAIVMIVYIKKTPVAGTLKEFFDVPKPLIKVMVGPIIAVTANEVCWGLGTFIYTKAYGYIGSDALAAVQISNTVTNFFLVIIFAMAGASLTIVGNAIGEGDEEKAKIYAKRIVFISLLLGTFLSFGVAILSPVIVSFFSITEAVAASTINILIINAVILIPRIYNIIMIVGIFRGGGDAKISLYLESATMFGIGVPLSIIGAFVFKLPLEYVVTLLMAEEVVKCILCVKRFKSNKWIHHITA